MFYHLLPCKFITPSSPDSSKSQAVSTLGSPAQGSDICPFVVESPGTVPSGVIGVAADPPYVAGCHNRSGSIMSTLTGAVLEFRLRSDADGVKRGCGSD